MCTQLIEAMQPASTEIRLRPRTISQGKQPAKRDRHNSSHVVFIMFSEINVFKTIYTQAQLFEKMPAFSSIISLSPPLSHYLCPMIVNSLSSFAVLHSVFTSSFLLPHSDLHCWMDCFFPPTLSPSLCRSSLLCTNPFLAGDCSGNID